MSLVAALRGRVAPRLLDNPTTAQLGATQKQHDAVVKRLQLVAVEREPDSRPKARTEGRFQVRVRDAGAAEAVWRAGDGWSAV